TNLITIGFYGGSRLRGSGLSLILSICDG
ncbi:unnamed protein product, partial [Rotaria sordida]